MGSMNDVPIQPNYTLVHEADFLLFKTAMTTILIKETWNITLLNKQTNSVSYILK
jgi:hypothetical protein